MRSAILCFCLLGITCSMTAQTAQQSPRVSFDIISVKPNHSENAQSRSNFPLGPGDVYVTNGGYFTATNFPLATYIFFAYKVMGNDLAALSKQLPDWASTERFDITARTDGDPSKDTKDQMRLMMRSLLADRFGLVTHYETRESSVFGLLLIKPGKTGPQFQQHPADASCTTVLSPASTPTSDAQTAPVGAGFPSQCGGVLIMPATVPGRFRAGARNVTMPFIANQLTAMGGLDRPVLDQTGLTGLFDFVIEWVPEAGINLANGLDSPADPNGPTFMQAVKEQLGLKLESQKGSTQTLIIDKVGHPTEN
jgi:uncharacterized protein (TIGR03435 family)